VQANYTFEEKITQHWRC